MGWPKGRPHSTEHVKRRVASWQSGLSRVPAWTPEMDATLLDMHTLMSFPTLRRHGPRRLGVSDGRLLERLKTLGLNKASKKAATLDNLRKLMAGDPPRTWQEIADSLRLTPATAISYAKEAGLTKPRAFSADRTKQRNEP